ncbi:unnamed protein product [Dibothriocephalus latus]|uniref:Uncharacterized protein n=1 Tax=Dibothriocephalus latus TaxID=60516 RepID=A0A3P6TTS3_DIBLA|nr:unnamed protein product [Dibothriocephalus latus]
MDGGWLWFLLGYLLATEVPQKPPDKTPTTLETQPGIDIQNRPEKIPDKKPTAPETQPGIVVQNRPEKTPDKNPTIPETQPGIVVCPEEIEDDSIAPPTYRLVRNRNSKSQHV